LPEAQRVEPVATAADGTSGVESGEQQAEGGTRSQEPRERRPRGRDRDRGPRPERGERSDRAERTDRPEPVAREEAAANEETSAEPRKSYFTASASSPSAGSGADQPVMVQAAMPAEAAVAEAIAAPVVVEVVALPVQDQSPAAAPTLVSVPVVPATTAATSTSAMPSVQAFVLPLDELAAVAQSSGLNWVNSDAAKIAAVQAAIEAEPKPVHVPRQRPAPPVLDEGPLVLVETQRDLRNMTLPFETNSSQT